MPFPFISSLFVTILLIFGILYEPVPIEDPLDLLPNKKYLLKSSLKLAQDGKGSKSFDILTRGLQS